MPRSKFSHTDRKEEREPRPDPRPGEITAIKSQVRDPERVSIFIDGAFSFGLAATIAEENALTVGQLLDAATLDRLMQAETLNRATAAALNFLAYRPRSEREIATRLRRSDTPPSVIDEVLERLRNWRYVDDEDFARRWVENRATHRPRGQRLLVQELREKGIDPELVSQVLDETEVDEEADALALARDRMRQLHGLEREVRERRLGSFLARRGYGYDVIRPVLQTLRGEFDSPETDVDPA